MLPGRETTGPQGSSAWTKGTASPLAGAGENPGALDVAHAAQSWPWAARKHLEGEQRAGKWLCRPDPSLHLKVTRGSGQLPAQGSDAPSHLEEINRAIIR